jgi:hypothetical protein
MLQPNISQSYISDLSHIYDSKKKNHDNELLKNHSNVLDSSFEKDEDYTKNIISNYNLQKYIKQHNKNISYNEKFSTFNDNKLQLNHPLPLMYKKNTRHQLDIKNVNDIGYGTLQKHNNDILQENTRSSLDIKDNDYSLNYHNFKTLLKNRNNKQNNILNDSLTTEYQYPIKTKIKKSTLYKQLGIQKISPEIKSMINTFIERKRVSNKLKVDYENYRYNNLHLSHGKLKNTVSNKYLFDKPNINVDALLANYTNLRYKYQIKQYFPKYNNNNNIVQLYTPYSLKTNKNIHKFVVNYNPTNFDQSNYILNLKNRMKVYNPTFIKNYIPINNTVLFNLKKNTSFNKIIFDKNIFEIIFNYIDKSKYTRRFLEHDNNYLNINKSYNNIDVQLLNSKLLKKDNKEKYIFDRTNTLFGIQSIISKLKMYNDQNKINIHDNNKVMMDISIKPFKNLKYIPEYKPIFKDNISNILTIGNIKNRLTKKHLSLTTYENTSKHIHDLALKYGLLKNNNLNIPKLQIMNTNNNNTLSTINSYILKQSLNNNNYNLIDNKENTLQNKISEHNLSLTNVNEPLPSRNELFNS